jgi:hypothetical protein
MLNEKTEIELATMRYVTAKTTSPIPKVHAYAFSDKGPNGLPLIIMDYVKGQSLKELDFKSGETWGCLLEPSNSCRKTPPSAASRRLCPATTIGVPPDRSFGLASSRQPGVVLQPRRHPRLQPVVLDRNSATRARWLGSWRYLPTQKDISHSQRISR